MDSAFLDEAMENAEAFSAGMVELEGSIGDEAAALVNELFRRAHNLKGMAAMEDQSALAQLAHGAEDVLSRYRDGGGAPAGDEVDALLAAADAMEAMVQALAAGVGPEPADELLARLRVFVAGAGGGVVPSAETTSPAAAPPVTWPDDLRLGFRVELVEGTPAPRARARLVVRAASEVADVAGTDPPDLHGVDASRYWFVIGVRGEPDQIDQAGVSARLRSFHEVETVTVVSLAGSGGGRDGDAASEERAGAAPSSAVPSPAAPATTTVRVDVDRLDQLLDLVGELVIEKNRLLARAAGVDDPPLHESAAALADVVGDLRDVVSRVRMVSLEATFTRMQRVARDVAREVGKPIELELIGATTELDRSVVDEVMQPLVHLVRNAIDHGIESAERRQLAGKDAVGRVQLRAAQQGPEVVIEVVDDGGGIDTGRLAAKAVEKGLVAGELVAGGSVAGGSVAGLEPTQIYDLMFLPGFTSRDEAGLVSGRGVGLDVVRGKVEALGGSIAVSSSLGAGSTFALHFPLSLVVLDSLLVRVGAEVWALPVARCEETVRLEPGSGGGGSGGGPGAPVGGGGSFEHRDEALPVIAGSHALGRSAVDLAPPLTAAPEPSFGVVVGEGGGRYLLTVDELVGRAEIVVKPAPKGIPGTEHIAGVTVLAEGQVALVPDLALVVRRARSAGDATVVADGRVS